MMWIFSYFFTDLLPKGSLRSAYLEAGYPWPEVHAFIPGVYGVGCPSYSEK